MTTLRRPLFDPPIVIRAMHEAVAKLDPRHMVRNPVMFVVLLGSVITTIALALDMAREQQQRQFATRRQPFGIDVMVDDILVTQRAEITKMRTWLKEWGLSP